MRWQFPFTSYGAWRTHSKGPPHGLPNTAESSRPIVSLTGSPHYCSVFERRDSPNHVSQPRGWEARHEYCALLRMLLTPCGVSLVHKRQLQAAGTPSPIPAGPCTMLVDTRMLSPLVIPLGATILIIALARYFRSRDSLNKSRLPYPPGPKGLPLIGNALDFPRGMPIWEGLGRMAEKYRTSMVPVIWRTYDRTLPQRRISCILTCLERT